MIDTINVDDLVNKILENEDLLPGDKASEDRLMGISEKYQITPYVLATNIFGVTQNAYRGLTQKTSNAKNIIILKDRIPQMIEDAIKVREIILQQENLTAGSKVNYDKLVEIAKKYTMREKILAVYVFEIPEYTFREIKNNSNINASILRKRQKENKKSKKNENLQDIREHILVSEKLKLFDKIDYKTICSLSEKYNIPKGMLAIKILEIPNSSYYHMESSPKRKGTILENCFLQDKLSEIKNNIIKKENLQPFDQINYDMLLQISERNNINDKVLAVDILGLTQSQYYNIKYKPKSVAIILKSDYEEITPQELKKLKNEIFEKEGLREGDRISFSKIEMLESKYNLPLKQMLYILGVTQLSYNFIKTHQQYNAIVKNMEVLLTCQILSETIEKNQYYTKKEIEQICQSNGISLENFFDYILGKAKYFGYNQYKEVLNSKGKIWIGERHSVSKKFAEQNIEEIQRIANVVSRNICNHFNGKKEI